MTKQYKLYIKDEHNKLKTDLISSDYDKVCKREKELNQNGFDTILWQI